MQRSELCRSRRELFNEYLLAQIGVDAAENEPLKVHLIDKLWLQLIGLNFHRAAPPQVNKPTEESHSLGDFAPTLHYNYRKHDFVRHPLRVESNYGFLLVGHAGWGTQICSQYVKAVYEVRQTVIGNVLHIAQW